MIPVVVTFEHPTPGGEIAALEETQSWLADRGLLAISVNEFRDRLRDRFGDSLLLNADFPWANRWETCENLLVPFYIKVDPRSFEPNRAEFWFHHSRINDAFLFKLVWGGQ